MGVGLSTGNHPHKVRAGPGGAGGGWRPAKATQTTARDVLYM